MIPNFSYRTIGQSYRFFTKTSSLIRLRSIENNWKIETEQERAKFRSLFFGLQQCWTNTHCLSSNFGLFVRSFSFYPENFLCIFFEKKENKIKSQDIEIRYRAKILTCEKWLANKRRKGKHFYWYSIAVSRLGCGGRFTQCTTRTV